MGSRIMPRGVSLRGKTGVHKEDYSDANDKDYEKLAGALFSSLLPIFTFNSTARSKN